METQTQIVYEGLEEQDHGYRHRIWADRAEPEVIYLNQAHAAAVTAWSRSKYRQLGLVLIPPKTVWTVICLVFILLFLGAVRQR